MARKYKLTQDVYVNCVNDKDCVFCKHCTDLFWDFSNGIYLKLCELGEDQHHDNCRYFEEEQQDGEEQR